MSNRAMTLTALGAGAIIGLFIGYLIFKPAPSESLQVIDFKKELLKQELIQRDSVIAEQKIMNQELANEVDRIQAQRDTAKVELNKQLDHIQKLRYRYETRKKYDFSSGVTVDSIARAFAIELSH